MKPGDREAAVDKYISKLQDEARKRKEDARAGFGAQMRMQQENRNRSQGTTTKGSWYFYNPSAVSLGVTEFQRVWGNRRLEDNWRRVNKQSFSDEAFEEEFGDSITVTIGDSSFRAYKYDRTTYLNRLPVSQKDQDSLDNQNIDAFFGLALLYKEKLYDLSKAAETFERLLDRYPENPYRIQAYFYLYRLYTDLEDTEKANEYKQKLINLDPDSDFAKILQDPDYADKLEEKRNQSNAAYKSCYAEFERGRYTACAKKCEANLKKFEGDPLEPKFAFLLAMSKGKRSEAVLVEEMKTMALKYPSSEEGQEAQRMVAFFTGEPEEVIVQKEESDSLAAYLAEEAGKFSSAQDADHFYILLFPAESSKANELSSFVSDFNQQYFSLDNLHVRGLFLDQEYQMISVRTINGGKKAITYFNALRKEPELKRILKELNCRQFVISQPNFAVLFQNKEPEAYRLFFEKEYGLKAEL